uniref:Uncharacterized protein n=1 Tax=Aegilops tauschii subsp. strangulata TaxID=200361 RepID=A0A452ZEB3_AEGTS
SIKQRSVRPDSDRWSLQEHQFQPRRQPTAGRQLLDRCMALAARRSEE